MEGDPVARTIGRLAASRVFPFGRSLSRPFEKRDKTKTRIVRRDILGFRGVFLRFGRSSKRSIIRMDIYAHSDAAANDVKLGESSLLAEQLILGTIGQQKQRNHYSTMTNNSLDDIRYVWRHCDAVCFDVDSTVCQDEAIDELAEFCGVGQQVSEVTKVAMNGGLSFRDALTARLNLIQPSRQKLEAFLKQNPPRLTPGIQDLIKSLQSRCVHVYLVSGGFSRIILPVARMLNVPEENVFANVLQFDENGNYRGFDLSQATSDSGGKRQICALLKQRNGYQRLVMIGDGATDMEACPPADAFIGFGGNQVRESVLKGSRWFVRQFDELRHALEEPEKQG